MPQINSIKQMARDSQGCRDNYLHVSRPGGQIRAVELFKSTPGKEKWPDQTRVRSVDADQYNPTRPSFQLAIFFQPDSFITLHCDIRILMYRKSTCPLNNAYGLNTTIGSTSHPGRHYFGVWPFPGYYCAGTSLLTAFHLKSHSIRMVYMAFGKIRSIGFKKYH